ncbi:MAG: hypothetical protein ACKVQW_15645 [Pyrinomonadaceae bacterium]
MAGKFMLATHKTQSYLISTLLLIALLAACEGSRPPKWGLCKSVKPELTSSTINTTDELVVYLDTSASMAGYLSPNGKTNFAASPDGNTIFSKTLLELRNVVTTMTPQPKVVVRRVDTNVSAPSFSDLELSQNSQNRGIYSGKETNLAGSIKSFSEPLDKDSADQAPPRFHILLTDGVQSSEKSDTNLSCDKGSDSLCVKNRLLELINAGWGGAIIGMRSEFGGHVYSEVSKKPVPYNSGKDPNKFRPFFLYIFSPDRSALGKLVTSLRRNLSPLGRADSFREYGLTTDYSAGLTSVEIPNEKPAGDLIRVHKDKSNDNQTPRIEVTSSVDGTVKKGKQQFVLTVKPAWSEHATSAGTPDELGRLLKWEMRSVYPDNEDPKRRYPSLKLLESKPANGQIDLTFETGWSLESGDLDWRMYRIIGTLDTEKNAPEWVMAWTTSLDTTADNANKTLNFESSVANLWKNSALEKYPVAEFCVRVGSK